MSTSNRSGQLGQRLLPIHGNASSHHQPRVRFSSVLSPDITRETVEKAQEVNLLHTNMVAAQKNYIPPGRSASPGPLATDFLQQQVAKQRNNNYHSTSLRNMVATSVNRTALHPGGIQYVYLLLLPLNTSSSLTTLTTQARQRSYRAGGGAA